MSDEVFHGLPIPKRVVDLSEEEKQNLQLWLTTMYTRLEHGFARGCAACGVDPREAFTPDQVRQLLQEMWNSLLRVPLWELIRDSETARQLNDGHLRPVTSDELLNGRYNT
jgi:hypothetical protein